MKDSLSTPVAPLMAALHAYVDARASALLAARKKLGIGELDAKALLHIAENPGTRPGDLKDLLGITSAGVTTLTDRLIERQVAKRDLDANDRRVVRLSATIDLSAEPWSALTRFDDTISDALSARTEEESDRMTELLRSLVAIAAST